MKILVTGLCLQGNKGGMALAQALQGVLTEQFKDASFTFSVPNAEFPREQLWADKLGMNVLRKISLKDFMPPWVFQKLSRNRRASYLSTMRNADLIVDLTALTYVGPPNGRSLGPLQTRFFYFLLARLFKIPFLAWTQTYGPFSSFPIRLMAKLDLKSQPLIFCRGEKCEQSVHALLPHKTTKVFPDVACVLSHEKELGRTLTAKVAHLRDHTNYVSLSPSSVLYKLGAQEGSNNHVLLCRNIIRCIHHLGHQVLLVPHTYRPSVCKPEACDKAVCDLIAEEGFEHPVPIVDADLSAIELKSIISNAAIHIGARYHSIIASLSSGVPCISLSWHDKYRDAMTMYGLGDFVSDSLDDLDKDSLLELIQELFRRREQIVSSLIDRQKSVAAKIRENGSLFANTYRDHFTK